jgi:dipeptide/tripeptide permease
MSKGHWLDCATDKYGYKIVEETKTCVNILEMFLFLPIFWALYGQNNSRWVFQATRMDGDIGWYTIKPDQMVMSTTLFIIVLIPIFEQFIFPIMSKVGVKTPLGRMCCGFIAAALAYISSAVVEWQIESSSDTLGMLWLLPQYFLIAIGEVCVWVSALSFAYTQAPESMKSVLSAFIYLTVAVGSLIVIVISGTHVIASQFHEYLFYSCLMIVNTALFVLMARRYRFVDPK